MPARPPGTLRLLLRPSLLLLQVLGLTAVVAAVLLGRWQLDAWQTHREDAAADLVDEPPVPLAEVLGPDDPFPGTAVSRPAEVTGRWLTDETFRVVDRGLDGVDGTWVVTPVDTGSGALPVVLGWSADPDPEVQLPEGSAELVGWLQPGEAAGAPDEDPEDDVLTSLRIASVSQRLEQDLYSGFAILDTPAALRGDLTAVTPGSLPAAPTSTGLRNFLYGVEWFLFGGFAAFLWWRWTRDELRVLRARAAGVNRVSGPAEDAPEPSEAGLPSRS
ncbi:SURF1 family protein [Nocardioides caldifontis]|uniref:SURF1 family protein n=1 Tax=Nocardioides caldifontis TaxID=2588938 RepID=UPI0011E03798|nr:SURF1 family protein [Nocardioides caldifontis]